jgi:Ala-tRNA(Pro) deacylase
MTAPMTADALTHALEEREIAYELIPHRRTMSAAAEARAVDVDPAHVAKTLILSTGDVFVRAVVPASERIDLRKVRRVLERDDVELASEQVLVGAFPEFELGAVPPLGGGTGDLVLVDRRVRDAGSVVFEAGAHDRSVRVSAFDLVSATDARVADICQS